MHGAPPFCQRETTFEFLFASPMKKNNPNTGVMQLMHYRNRVGSRGSCESPTSPTSYVCFFDTGFTRLSRIFHVCRADHSAKFAEKPDLLERKKNRKQNLACTSVWPGLEDTAVRESALLFIRTGLRSAVGRAPDL